MPVRLRRSQRRAGASVARIALDGSALGEASTPGWRRAARRAPVRPAPDWAFNIIYSSGTTGDAQGHRAAARHALGAGPARRHGLRLRPGQPSRCCRRRSIPTPPWSSFLPTVGLGRHGGPDGRSSTPPEYLRLAERHRAHPHDAGAGAIPAPDGACPSSTRYDLSRFRMKFCTSAPFAAALKAEVLRALAGRADRVLRHDRGRRQLHPRGAPASRQAAHRRPADAEGTTSG